MKHRFGRKYILYFSLLLAGVFLSVGLLAGPLKKATDALAAPAVEKSLTGKPGEGPSQLEKLYGTVFVVLTIYGAHLAARFFSDSTWRKRDRYIREVRWSGLDIFAMVVLFLALAGVYNTFFSSSSGASGGTEGTTAREVLVVPFFYLVVLLFGVWVLRQKGCSFSEGMGLTMRPYARLILIGVVAFVAFQPLLLIYRTAVMAVFSGLSLPIEGHPVVEELLKPDKIPLRVSLALSVVLSAPFFEEIFFRGFLYQGLRRTIDAGPAIFLTAALFALIHPGVFQASLIFPLGLVLAYLMERTGSVIPCIVMHFLVNGTSLLLTFLVAG
ncbi:CPBP family intramembrane metalloprotease [bacterium]|nr:CPBP family intramembrane metalloprotease [bacterium]